MSHIALADINADEERTRHNVGCSLLVISPKDASQDEQIGWLDLQDIDVRHSL